MDARRISICCLQKREKRCFSIVDDENRAADNIIDSWHRTSRIAWLPLNFERWTVGRLLFVYSFFIALSLNMTKFIWPIVFSWGACCRLAVLFAFLWMQLKLNRALSIKRRTRTGWAPLVPANEKNQLRCPLWVHHIFSWRRQHKNTPCHCTNVDHGGTLYEILSLLWDIQTERTKK